MHNKIDFEDSPSGEIECSDDEPTGSLFEACGEALTDWFTPARRIACSVALVAISAIASSIVVGRLP